MAVEGDQLLGTVTWCPPGSPYRQLATADNQGEFRTLSVAPEGRRRGVGRALVVDCVDRAGAAGLTEVVLCSLSVMTPAHALYESFGFVRRPELDWFAVARRAALGVLARPRTKLTYATDSLHR